MYPVNIDFKAQIDFLVDLPNTPSPTAYHAEVVPSVQQAFEALAGPGLMIEEA
jgi:hypothetical protein